MGSFGPNGASTAANDATVGTVAYSNPSNALANDGSSATAVLLIGQQTQYLMITGFLFSVPVDATVNGIQVDVLRSCTVNLGSADASIKIVKGGAISGTDQSAAAQWPSSAAFTSFGDSVSSWGLSWVPADINASNFGVVISAVASIASTAAVDFVRMTVYYTGSNRPASQTNYVRVGSGVSRNEVN